MSEKYIIPDRKKELEKIIEGIDEDVKTIVTPMLDDMVFLENMLKNLRRLPFIKVHPEDKTIQKPTIAAKQYKELLQQYNNCVKILCGVLGKSENDEGSTLREGLQKLYEKYGD